MIPFIYITITTRFQVPGVPRYNDSQVTRWKGIATDNYTFLSTNNHCPTLSSSQEFRYLLLLITVILKWQDKRALLPVTIHFYQAITIALHTSCCSLQWYSSDKMTGHCYQPLYTSIKQYTLPSTHTHYHHHKSSGTCCCALQWYSSDKIKGIATNYYTLLSTNNHCLTLPSSQELGTCCCSLQWYSSDTMTGHCSQPLYTSIKQNTLPSTHIHYHHHKRSGTCCCSLQWFSSDKMTGYSDVSKAYSYNMERSHC